jgi:mannose/cellobiose epimerase-like protein (N-acyl-D-glucosamine 2-epimerase family)
MTVTAFQATGRRWVEQASHRAWLLRQAEALLDFHQFAAIDPRGGFFELDDVGRPLVTGAAAAPPAGKGLHTTTRMVHCFAAAWLMGRPGADRLVDHGMRYLWERHRDPVHGGYFWVAGHDGPVDATKQAYGHAFVLLAASSAKVAGHPDADRLLQDVTTVLGERFWEEAHGAAAEEFTADWQPFTAYRGQNANMHLTEALMAAFEATGERAYLDKASRIADLLIRRVTAANGWRLPEHFHPDWQVDWEHDGNPMFRPYGTTPGHWLEWSRLLLQLWELDGRRQDWLPDAARNLFRRAVEDAWDPRTGGFYYTLDWQGRPRVRDRYWWPVTEAIGAAAFLGAIDRDPFHEGWYRRLWSWAADHLIDRECRGWRHQLNDDLLPTTHPFFGKPDIYHCFQACLIPLLPTAGSITKGLIEEGMRL